MAIYVEAVYPVKFELINENSDESPNSTSKIKNHIPFPHIEIFAKQILQIIFCRLIEYCVLRSTMENSPLDFFHGFVSYPGIEIPERGLVLFSPPARYMVLLRKFNLSAIA